ncbi:MAG: response regulator [Anaerolineae bacterium]|nr:response regulator [Anaerolineae bacterium]
MGFLFANILIVDSSSAFVSETRQVLQAAGYVVRHIEKGREVLAQVEDAPPDLILLATELVDMDGYDVVRQLKRTRELPFVPIIMMGAQERHADITAALNAGADEFLRKSVSNVELLVRVRAMLRLKQTTDELADLNATLEEKVVERTRELEQAHAHLRHTEKLSALGNLAASVAHDINNPLTGILSSLYLMRQDLPADSALVEDVDLIEQQVHIISKLVRQLQNFARPPRLERHPVMLSDIVNSVVTFMRKDLQKNKIEILCECTPDLPLVMAVPDQMGEIFLNLVINARDAMPDGGTLRVYTGTADHNNVYVKIADTGMGISEEIQHHIFEPFFTTKGDKGTGLGLAICYRIVQEHGGNIEVESVVGQGTKFIVQLPAMRE